MKETVKILSLLLFFLICGCTEKIDLPLDTEPTRLVVEGFVKSGYEKPVVYLSESTSYYFNTTPPSVTGATVVLNNGSFNVYLNEVSPGCYTTNDLYYGEPGKIYTLTIDLKTPIGGYSRFTSVSEMEHYTNLDSVVLTFYPDLGEKGLWEARCWFPDYSGPDFYRFHLIRNSEPVTWKLSKWIITDDRFFDGKYVNGEPFTYLSQESENERLEPGDTLDIELHHISRAYYNFIQDAQSELRGSDPLFSGPGANVRGNISNGAICFFEAFPVSRYRLKVY